jgi:hypothetical protein
MVTERPGCPAQVGSNVQVCPRNRITVRLAGAISTRQNDFGGASSVTRIAARITDGCVTATNRDLLLVSESSQPRTLLTSPRHRLAAVWGAGGIGEPDG